MAKDYTPKVGELVESIDHGVCKVLAVSDEGMTTLRKFLVGRREESGPEIKVPRRCLKPFKEDASQAAARIVREATEGKS
jgi:hypothetical protein